MSEGLDVVTGGTDNHLMLVDLRNLGLTGQAAQQILDDIGITVNKNAIPFDTASPTITSGIRLGTPAATTRGMGPDEMKGIARIIGEALKNPHQAAFQKQLTEKVKEITSRFPLYAHRIG
ncbi:Serine hydroxymethyltransferase [compost metagenome]